MTVDRVIEILDEKHKSGGRYPLVTPETFGDMAKAVRALRDENLKPKTESKLVTNPKQK